LRKFFKDFTEPPTPRLHINLINI